MQSWRQGPEFTTKAPRHEEGGTDEGDSGETRIQRAETRNQSSGPPLRSRRQNAGQESASSDFWFLVSDFWFVLHRGDYFLARRLPPSKAPNTMLSVTKGMPLAMAGPEASLPPPASPHVGVIGV